jgi:hypothetical protein
VADALGVKVQSVGRMRKKLIWSGLICGPTHGDTALAVPLFDEFTRRTMPDWKPAGRGARA